MEDTLQRFVHDALAKGLSKAEIEGALLEARWPQDEVRSALDVFADVEFPVPVPRPKPYLSAREAFVYLVLFTMLYLSAWSLGSVLFQFIDRALPDATQATYRSFALEALRWAVATLLIAFPGYLYLSRRAYTAARSDPEKRQSKVRKWLTYLTLFLAAGFLVGDLITLVYSLLEGELTARFLLKVSAVGGIAGSIFGYYLWDLRQDDLKPELIPARRPGLRLFAGCVTAAVAASLVGGLILAGSPGSARKAALDDQREGHLAQIAAMIDLYWDQEGGLPGDLESLRQTRGVWVESIHDPETDLPYEYRITGERAYELCAVFDTASDPDETGPGHRGAYVSGSKFWQHPAGRTCFSIEVAEESD
jgi:hypothetical protein